MVAINRADVASISAIESPVTMSPWF